MRSALIVLRDGSRFNMFFGSDQLPLSESYESCASKLPYFITSPTKRIIRKCENNDLGSPF